MVLTLQHAAESALRFVFPGACAACDAPGEEPFCGPCADTLIEAPAGCPLCGEPGPDEWLARVRPRRCAHCREQAPPFARAAAAYLHGGALAEAIRRLKYERREELARPLGLLFAAVPAPAAEVVTPIPLHPRRLRERGFDQARLLARAAARQLGLPTAELLIRTRSTDAQVGQDRRARARNVRFAFTTTRSCEGLRVCLIDDVLTTGATAASAAMALLRGGASRVEVRTLTRAG